MNAQDWIVMKQGYSRPINPRLLAAAMGKSSSAPRKRTSARSARRLIYEVLKSPAMLPDVSAPLHFRTKAQREAFYLKALRRGGRDAAGGFSVLEQSALGYAGLEAQARHTVAVRRSLPTCPPRPRKPKRPDFGMNYSP